MKKALNLIKNILQIIYNSNIHKYKNRLATVLKIFINLYFGPGKINAGEFLFFNLHDFKTNISEKRKFIGGKVESRIIRQCNNRDWYLLTRNKVLFYNFMNFSALPIAKILAVYNKNTYWGNFKSLKTSIELHDFLIANKEIDFFLKPINGLQGHGAFKLQVISSKEFLVNNSETCTFEQLLEIVPETDGFVVQNCLKPHPDLARIYGQGIGTIRAITLFDGDQASVLLMYKRIPRLYNVTDNIIGTDNIMGRIDMKSGCISAAFSSNFDKIEIHPDTNQVLVGAQIPWFREVSEIVLNATEKFHGIKLQAWDIALCKNGPVLIEVNFWPNLATPQKIMEQGLLEANFVNFLKKCNYKYPLPK